jgi:4-hydroxybenzoate polyprenyltransferase
MASAEILIHQVPPVSPIRRGCCVAAMCLLEARPSVLAVFLLRFLASGMLTQVRNSGGHPAHILSGALAWEFAIFSIYLFNGVMDVTEDRANGSRRPIATGRLTARAAATVAACAATASLALGAASGPALAGPLVAVLIIGYLYSGPPGYLKRRPAGTVFAGLALGLLTYVAGLVVPPGAGDRLPGAAWLTVVITMSLWMGLVGVPAKDLGDVAGDAAAGRRTVPAVCGERAARIMIGAAAMLVTVVFTALVTAGRLASLAGPAAVLGCGAVTVVLVTLSGRSRGNRTRRRLPYRAFMLTQFAVNTSVILCHFLLSTAWH